MQRDLQERSTSINDRRAVMAVVPEASVVVGAQWHTRRDKDEYGGFIFAVGIVNLLGILVGLEMLKKNQRALETVICSERTTC